MRGLTSPLLAVLLALVVVVPVAAKEPFRPIPGHQPRFITEMDSRGPSADCLWASAQMYLDKLTAGRAVVDHERLRTLSGSRTRGATLAEVKTAMREAGLPFAFSPGGGDPLTWTTLLARLERGGGAIVEGTYHSLPRRYGRWDPAFWAETASYHAVYIERYDRASDRVWLMDPLATGSWTGEWIAVRYLVRFVWHTGGGLLYAAATPAAAPLPFAGVTLEAPTASVFADRVTVAWPVESAPAGWTPSGRFVPSVERLPEGIVLPPEIVTNPAPTASVAGNLLGAPASPLDPKVRRSAGAVTADIALPSEPGLYRIGGDLLESRFDDRVGVAPATIVRVSGPRRAFWAVSADSRTTGPGGPVAISGSVLNIGLSDWTDAAPSLLADEVRPPLLRTRVVARWIPAHPAKGQALAPLVVMAAPLGPGAEASFEVSLVAPLAPGLWSLVLDVTDDRAGSFAAAGSEVALVEVLVRSATQGVITAE